MRRSTSKTASTRNNTPKSSPHDSALGSRAGKSTRVRAKTAAPSSIPATSPKKSKRSSAAPAGLQWTEQLSDGTHVLVRPIEKRDAQLERDFIQRLSPDARHMRFLGQIGTPSDELIRRFTDIDYLHDMAFVALVHRDGKTLEIGVSRFNSTADGKYCECAVTVSDEWRHRGVATLLMRHLIDAVRARGIRRMVSFDVAENFEMRQLADTLGFKREADPGDATMVIHSLAL